MLKARFFTPAVRDEAGWQHAAAELVVGSARLCFLVDLDHWTATDYAAQWRDAVSRLMRGESSSAFMSAYRGVSGSSHVLWALWRDDTHVYIQEQSLLVDELETSFDPRQPYDHLGTYVPTAAHGLPIPEWHVPIIEVSELLSAPRPSLPPTRRT